MTISREEEYAELRGLGYSDEAIARRWDMHCDSLAIWLRRVEKLRAKPVEKRTRCKRGHDLLDPENVHITSSGYRRCKRCRQELERVNRHRRNGSKTVAPQRVTQREGDQP